MVSGTLLTLASVLVLGQAAYDQKYHDIPANGQIWTPTNCGQTQPTLARSMPIWASPTTPAAGHAAGGRKPGPPCCRSPITRRCRSTCHANSAATSQRIVQTLDRFQLDSDAGCERGSVEPLHEC